MRFIRRDKDDDRSFVLRRERGRGRQTVIPCSSVLPTVLLRVSFSCLSFRRRLARLLIEMFLVVFSGFFLLFIYILLFCNIIYSCDGTNE